MSDILFILSKDNILLRYVVLKSKNNKKIWFQENW